MAAAAEAPARVADPRAPPPLPALPASLSSLASLAPAPFSSLPPASSPGPRPTWPGPAVPGVGGCPAMELLQPDPAAPSPALSPAGVRGGAERPSHLPGLRLGAQGLLGSPERAATFSPVATLTQTMHDLAGLGR